jgi:hypothetical protein
MGKLTNAVMAKYYVDWESRDGKTSGRVMCQTLEDATATRNKLRKKGLLAYGYYRRREKLR